MRSNFFSFFMRLKFLIIDSISWSRHFSWDQNCLIMLYFEFWSHDQKFDHLKKLNFDLMKLDLMISSLCKPYIFQLKRLWGCWHQSGGKNSILELCAIWSDQISSNKQEESILKFKWITKCENSVCLSVCLSVRLSVCPSVRLSVCPSVRLSVCPSVRLSVF